MSDQQIVIEQEVAVCAAVANNDPWPCVLELDHHGRHCDTNGYTWRHDHKYGRPDLYEITWMSGHVETVVAHQITYPHQGMYLAGLLSGNTAADGGAARIKMHAEIDGRWCLTLAAREEDIRTMRLVTDAERIPGAGS